MLLQLENQRKKIVKYYQSEEVAEIINQISNGSRIPVWRK